MEGIIMMIVIFIISSIFKGKKQGQEKPKHQMPPFSNQKMPQQPAKASENEKPAARSLEDFANEVFGELNKKQQAKPTSFERPKSITNPPEIEIAVKEGRQKPQTTVRPLVQQLTKQNDAAFSVVPKSRQDLMQAVVMAEVLGPPKSKQR